MDPDVAGNHAAWEKASQKHVREYDDHLAQADTGSSLLGLERDALRPLLAAGPRVVHLQSGNGLEDVPLIRAGARSVVGVDFSEVAATAAQHRADDLGEPCRYIVAELPGAPLADGCADLVYTGKGALIWMRDIDAWARDVARLLAPGGHLYVYEAHPLVPLWTWDDDEPRVRPDRGYFETSHLNDTYPANGAREWQWTLGEIVTAVVAAGLELRTLMEYPEPFWRPDGVDAAVWRGQVPNTYALLARRQPPV